MARVYRGEDRGNPAIYRSDGAPTPPPTGILIDSVQLIDNVVQIDTLEETS